MFKCSECGSKFHSKRGARKHYRENHSGEIATPEEYLDRFESEQRDFSGEEPTTEGHNPEYLVENEPEGEDTRLGTLHEFERDKDGSLPEYEQEQDGDAE